MTEPTPSLDGELDSALAGYTRRASCRRARRSAAEVLGYTAAAGGLAFAGGDALGAIVHHSTAASLLAGPSGSVIQGIDLDGAGGADWQILVSAQTSFAFASHLRDQGGATGTVAVGAALFNNAKNLAPGFLVGPTLASGVFNTKAANFYGIQSGVPYGPLANNSTGYLGLHFNGDTGTVGTQYAWVKVRFDHSVADVTLKMNILEWAYDDSGAPIAVGNTGSVPLPGTPQLALLGLGVMGLQTYRRRRDEALKRLAEGQAAA